MAPEPVDERIPLWPENRAAVEVFLALETQWRPGGGLDYAALWATLDGLVKRKRRRQVFRDVRVMERAAIEVFAGGE